MLHPLPAATQRLEDGVFALTNAIRLDGRRPVSSHPRDAVGYAPVNCYVLLGEDGALVIDSGYAIHRASLLEQLASLLPPALPLTLLSLRNSEYNSVSNARAIAERFNVTELRTAGGIRGEDIHLWLDFDTERPWGDPQRGALAKARGVSTMGMREMDAPDGRKLEVIRPDLQLLSTYWIYERSTCTLFSSDAFGHMWRQTEEGPWIVDSVEDAPTADQVAEFLAEGRYWWTVGADTEPVRENLTKLLDTYDIVRIAPIVGCVIEGREVVRHHFGLFDEALRQLGERPEVGPDVIPFYARA